MGQSYPYVVARLAIQEYHCEKQFVCDSLGIDEREYINRCNDKRRSGMQLYDQDNQVKIHKKAKQLAEAEKTHKQNISLLRECVKNANAVKSTHYSENSCAYVINFYDDTDTIVFCKVGSTSDFNTRLRAILNGEYLKRWRGHEVCNFKVESIYLTTDRYGAYTIENMLHTHFLRQGYERDGNDYFLLAEGNKDELNNDFPLRLMSILLSPDIDHKPLYATIKRLLTLMKYI